MGAVLLDGAVVEKHAMVAAGALVRQNTRIPAGEVSLLFSQKLMFMCYLCLVEFLISISARIP